MGPEHAIEFSYFPGCSLATSAKESNQSLVRSCELIGLSLVEIDDWGCCGSSSAHSVDRELALSLAARTLALAPPGRPLLTMCPSCFRNLLSAHIHLQRDPELRRDQERKWGRPIDPGLKIVTFLEILHFLDQLRRMGAAPVPVLAKNARGLKVAPYYGCMSMFPPAMRRTHIPFNLMERQLDSFGVEVLMWPLMNRCCGTFLSATKPDVSTPLVNEIVQAAVASGADCLVTACAMCQLNLELRCSLKKQIPTLHFTELMALVLGAGDYGAWFNRHLVDPRPLLREKKLID